ncbi:prepilin-type N-terminal cleavage/methylation domain-containing protein [Pectobacterium odoriferum]|nr:prepilin-type N-terminal cleavage/methylation domain-containing protein [Pectobacterium odoriferum]
MTKQQGFTLIELMMLINAKIKLKIYISNNHIG